MWLLNFIPDSTIALFIHSIVGMGAGLLVIGFLMSRILGIYAALARILGVLLLVAGVYFEGGLQNELYWREQVRLQQEEVARINAEAKQITERVETKYIERIKVVKEKTDAIIQKVPEYITKEHDAACVVPDSVRMLLNAAAKNELPNTAGQSDETTTSPAQ